MDGRDFIELYGPHVEHIRDKLEKVEEAYQGINHWQRRYKQASEEVENHVKQCGTCINLMMNAGDLVRLEDWWNLTGRHPGFWDLRN